MIMTIYDTSRLQLLIHYLPERRVYLHYTISNERCKYKAAPLGTRFRSGFYLCPVIILFTVEFMMHSCTTFFAAFKFRCIYITF